MIGKEVCEVIIYLHYDHDKSPDWIAAHVRTMKHAISARSVERILDRFEETGEVSLLCSAYRATLTLTTPHRSECLAPGGRARETSM